MFTLRTIRWTEYIAHMREMRNENKILFGMPDCRPMRRSENNIKIYFAELSLEAVD
jgi:hypothetical protein